MKEVARQVALIRGINVGKAKRVPMAELRDALEARGFARARTLLNSGNVVFDATVAPAEAAAEIERILVEVFSVSARVLALDADAIAEVAAENSLVEIADDPSRLMVAFLFDPASARTLEPIAGRDWNGERLALGSHAAYLWCPRGILDSPLHAAVQAELGEATTVRNWRTVSKIVAAAQAP